MENRRVETDKESNDPPMVVIVPLIISIIYSLILAFLPELLFFEDFLEELALWMPGILSFLIIFGYTKSASKSIVSGILGMVFYVILIIIIILYRISSGAPGLGLH